jgi:hypothetical protein
MQPPAAAAAAVNVVVTPAPAAIERFRFIAADKTDCEGWLAAFAFLLPSDAVAPMSPHHRSSSGGGAPLAAAAAGHEGLPTGLNRTPSGLQWLIQGSNDDVRTGERGSAVRRTQSSLRASVLRISKSAQAVQATGLDLAGT